MTEEIAALLPEWTIRTNMHWDKDVSYCLFRDGYKPFRLTDRLSKRIKFIPADEQGPHSSVVVVPTAPPYFIIASTPPAYDDLQNGYETKEAALSDLKQIAESRRLFPDPQEMLGLPEIIAPVSIKREGPLEKLTMIFGHDNEKILATSRNFQKAGCYVFRFPETDDMGRPLHPSKHAAIIKDYIERFTICCIATHSEMMMLYVLREVAKKRLTPEQVDVIYVCEDGKELLLRLDNEGDFIDRWPEGFFEERMELLFYEE